jgi:hypothetical protein
MMMEELIEYLLKKYDECNDFLSPDRVIRGQ